MNLTIIHDEYITGKTADALRESEQFFNQEIIDQIWAVGSDWPASVPPRDHAEAVATIEVKSIILASLHKKPMDAIVWTDSRLTALADDLPVLVSAGFDPLWHLMVTHGCLDPMVAVLVQVGFSDVQSIMETMPSALRERVLGVLPAFMTQSLEASVCDTAPLGHCFAGDEAPVLSAVWQLNWADHRVWFSRVQAAIQSVIDAEAFDWATWLRAYRMVGCGQWLADYRESLCQCFVTNWLKQPTFTAIQSCLDQWLWRDRQWLISHLYHLANTGSIHTREQAWPFHKQLCDWYTNNQ